MRRGASRHTAAQVNLSDNSLLTDRSLVQLLRQLSREPLVSALRRPFGLGRGVRDALCGSVAHVDSAIERRLGACRTLSYGTPAPRAGRATIIRRPRAALVPPGLRTGSEATMQAELL